MFPPLVLKNVHHQPQMCETTRNFSNTIRTERKPNDNKTREIKSKFLGVFNSLGKRTVRYENPVLLNNPLNLKITLCKQKTSFPPKLRRKVPLWHFKMTSINKIIKQKKKVRNVLIDISGQNLFCYFYPSSSNYQFHDHPFEIENYYSLNYV